MAAISKSARVCETCGSPIETTSAGDLGCIACLIGTGLDAETEQSDPAFASASDQLGAYTIEHHGDGSVWELGHGAMGVTYRAIDKALDRPVALKIINTDRGSHSAEARERFMREARAAAALRHPNVATVYQFGVRDETGQFFYAMELVEGKTLEERVCRLGPLDVLTTIDIALQVTAALEAAEERGLVHRDLKPGNLMLVEAAPSPLSSSNDNTTRTSHPPRKSATGALRPQVKVIDFGVAKAVAEKTNAMALTHGGFVGTPAFASPEQFTNAPVDVRSDIYSLGATLWFLLTGHMLFSGRTVEEIQEARQSKPLPLEQLKGARVPRRFVSLLVSMLAIEPAARPAGTRELGARLQAIRASITGRGKTAAWVALAAAIVALATIVAVREFHSTKATPAAIPEKSIAVLPFQNLSPDPDNAYFADGIQEEVLTRLAGIADLKVISRIFTERYKSKPRNLSQIAKQLGVANILEGSVQKADDQVRVSVQLINAQTDSRRWAENYDLKSTDIPLVESEIAKGIAESLQAKLTDREEHELAVKPTNNSEAYDAYLRGLVFARSRFSLDTDFVVKAASFYERAVQLDPNFALAWARLSRVNAHLYLVGGHEATSARRDAAKRALDNAQKLAPNSAETMLALAYYQYWVLHDYGAAKTTFGRVTKMLPGSSEVPWALGLITRSEGNLVWIFNPANGHEYRLTTGYYWGVSDTVARTRPDWFDAEDEAVASGGHLATINDEAENNWLVSLFVPGDPTFDAWGNFLWIGFSDFGSEGSFYWISGERATFTNWDGVQPDNAHEGGEDSVHTNHFGGIGLWNDLGALGNSPHHSSPYRGIIERAGPPTANAGMASGNDSDDGRRE